ncbi:ABC transporter permease [Streptococcus gallolyticus]|uniref:ABC transporter permease n=1 Tax=Streptococcus hepaticus TaxID=3349163 RepID=UPI001C969ADD|nr:ABC transporter permease [Streptococcus gallolyticus]MBY5041962.1 ABC transporter permease [Streptococcus gallolyticus]
MKKYIFNRILRSLVSLFLVTTLIYIIVYTMVPRKKIFEKDQTYVKMAADPYKKADYVNTVYEKMGYIDYMNSNELQTAAEKKYENVTSEPTEANKKIYKKYLTQLGKGWELHQFETNNKFYATREIPIYQRIAKFYGNLVQVDHTNKIKDKANPNLERYIRLEKDPSIGWALVGSGTEHKYLLYANGQFPFIHQNFITFDLGVSYPTYANIDVLEVLSQGQGKALLTDVTFPTGVTKKSSVNIYTRTYKSPGNADKQTIANFGEGDAYTATKTRYQDPSMLVNSSIIGIISVIITYVFGIPLGILMSRYKNKGFDTIMTAVLSFLMALPSVAFIYIFRFAFGKLFGLPDTFPILGAQDFRSYLLPALLLGLLGIPGMAVWIRRYFIDLQTSDYVRFARAKGLSESEISRGHIFRNAMVPVVISIPGSILGVIVGATFTESVFAFPGMGKMLIDSINNANNTMVVALTFIFAALSIFSLLLGDLLMTVVDPRIKLDAKGGK